jgi:Domain of unknown function (DUF397)
MLRGVLTVRRWTMGGRYNLADHGASLEHTTGDLYLETAEETARYAAAFGKLSAGRWNRTTRRLLRLRCGSRVKGQRRQGWCCVEGAGWAALLFGVASIIRVLARLADVLLRHRRLSRESQVEVAFVDGRVAVRDSKDWSGPILVFTPFEWGAFLSGVRDAEFELPRPRSPDDSHEAQ